MLLSLSSSQPSSSDNLLEDRDHGLQKFLQPRSWGAKYTLAFQLWVSTGLNSTRQRYLVAQISLNPTLWINKNLFFLMARPLKRNSDMFPLELISRSRNSISWEVRNERLCKQQSLEPKSPIKHGQNESVQGTANTLWKTANWISLVWRRRTRMSLAWGQATEGPLRGSQPIFCDGWPCTLL